MHVAPMSSMTLNKMFISLSENKLVTMEIHFCPKNCSLNQYQTMQITLSAVTGYL